MIHYPRAATCLFTRLRAEESSDFIKTHCGVSSCERPYEIVIYLYVFLIYDILEYVYPSACDKKFSVQIDPYLVQRKYIFRIYISKLITTQSPSPYKVVFVSTSMVIVIVLLIQHVRWCERCLLITESPKTPGHYRYLSWVLDTACQLVVQNSRVVICIQIFYAWNLKLGDVMNLNHLD